MELIKITPDFQKVKSILKMVELVEKRIKIQDKIKFSPLILSDYYEIIKELITALLLADGYKTLSHKNLIDYLDKKYDKILKEEIYLIDKLRILRNRITYEGFEIKHDYLKDNEFIYIRVIKKLKVLITKKLR